MKPDRYTGSEKIIDNAHYMIHDGSVWGVSQYYTAPAAAVINLAINTTNTSNNVQCSFSVESSGQALLKFYEGVTVSAAGTTITAYNFNRTNSGTTCSPKFFYNATWSTKTETLLTTELLPGGSVPPTRVGAVSSSDEWILSPSKRYLIELTNQAGSTITATINIKFNEG